MARVAQWGYSFQSALQKWEKDEVDLHMFNEALKRDLNDMVFEDIDQMMRRLAKLLLYADLACSDQLAAEYHRRAKKAKVKKKRAARIKKRRQNEIATGGGVGVLTALNEGAQTAFQPAAPLSPEKLAEQEKAEAREKELAAKPWLRGMKKKEDDEQSVLSELDTDRPYDFDDKISTLTGDDSRSQLGIGMQDFRDDDARSVASHGGRSVASSVASVDGAGSVFTIGTDEGMSIQNHPPK